ncbi:MAG: hypothetical protein JJE16_13530 [Nitrospiraceae bacterium]|nr:hypothetical protein [Nitrospiraceae bacterium]
MARSKITKGRTKKLGVTAIQKVSVVPEKMARSSATISSIYPTIWSSRLSDVQTDPWLQSLEQGRTTPILGMEKYFNDKIASKKLTNVYTWAVPGKE